MKVIVCGGRDYHNCKHIMETLDLVNEDSLISHLITGGATGADNWGEWWATQNGVQSVVCKANWSKYGNGAGPRRNAHMLSLGPDLVVAFPGGKGTANMVRIARAAGIRVMEVPSPAQETSSASNGGMVTTCENCGHTPCAEGCYPRQCPAIDGPCKLRNGICIHCRNREE